MIHTPFSDELHDLKIQILKKLEIHNPKKKQIELVSTLLLGITLPFQLVLHPKLSNREKSCLLLAAKGKTAQQTADLLDVKSSTIRTWHKKIKKKLECQTLAQAVFEAMRYGYIPSPLPSSGIPFFEDRQN
jgi:DNA-binding CsgD family transcriptional regulator